MITQERLKELLHYDHENGLFTWRPGRRGVPPWSIAGNMKSDGYMKVQVDNKYYLSHRLVWLYVFGYWPKEHIDHINGDKADNRLSNLREASPCQNEYNKGVRKDSMTGVKGVHWHIRKEKFRVRIKVDGKEKTLGFFRTIKEASAAYRKAELELRGEFAHGARLDRAE